MKTNTITHNVAFLIAIFAAISSQADTISWTNTSGGNWSAAANWSPNQVPGVSDDVLITVTGTYTVTLDVSPIIDSLTIGSVSGQQTLDVGSEILTLNDASEVSTNGILVMSGGGFLGGSGSLTVNGTLNWNGGMLGTGAYGIVPSLTVATNGVLNIEGAMYLFGALTNEGTVNWQAGEVQVYNGGPYIGVIWNEVGGLWDIQCDQLLANDYGDEQFYNFGTLRKSAGTGTTTLNVFLDNSGSVHAENGTIQLNGGSDLGGNFVADTDTLITLAGGSYNGSPGVDLSGAGTFSLNGGTLTLFTNVMPNLQLLSGTVLLDASFQGGAITNLTLNGPTLAGTNQVNGSLNLNGGAVSGMLTVASGGTLNWNGGMLGTGAYGNVPSLTVATNGVLNIEGAMYLFGALMNEGTVNWQAAEVQVFNGGPDNGVIWNEVGGLWDIQCDQTLANDYGDEQFYNFGTLRKSAGTGTTALNLFLDNSGTVEADTGTISFQGGYSSSSSANLSISLGGATPGSGYGSLSFNTPLAVSGTFNVSTRNGFLPSAGDSFQVLSYPSATNQFDCLSGLDLGGGILLQPQFNSTGLTLLATAYTTNASLPQLFINPTLGGVTITWPVGFPDWTLQSTTNLTSQAWELVSIACGNQALVATNTPQQYFRLKKNN